MTQDYSAKKNTEETKNLFLPTQNEVRHDPALLEQLLIEGAERFRAANLHPGSRYYDTVTQGQKPLAVIVKCVDSRYPAEIVLDLPVGTILIHKSVGGLIRAFDPDKDQPDSEWVTMLFGVRELGTPCVIRKGHSGCGCADKLFTHYVQTTTSEAPADRPKIIDPLQKWIHDALPLAAQVIGDDYLTVPREQLIRKLEEAMVRADVEKIVKGFDLMIDLGILSSEKKPIILGNLYEMSTATLYQLNPENGQFTLSYEPRPLPNPQREKITSQTAGTNGVLDRGFG